MMQHHRFVHPWISRALTTAAFCLTLLLIGGPGSAQQTDIHVTPPPQIPVGEDPLRQALDAAQTTLNDGLTTMNEGTLRRAAAMYEDIIQQYALDNRSFDAYFAAAYIYIEYLQTLPDYQHAQNLLTLLINNHPSNYSSVTEAYLTRAHLEYRCLRDYRSAQEDLASVLRNPPLATALGTREIETKVLLAKCYQKLGEYDNAKAIWQELAISNPELDTEGRLQWIQDAANWYLIDDGRLRLFFDKGVDRDTYTSCLAQIRDGLTQAETLWQVTPSGTIDVYLYASTDRLFDFTIRSKGFAIPTDAEIHLAPSDTPDSKHLAGWVLSQRLNSRPEGTVFPFFRAGFCHYFIAAPDEINRRAAREIYYYGGNLPDYELLFPLSFDYTYSEEYATMSASFLHYLIEDRGVSIDGLEKFYRLLWSRPDSRFLPPLIAALSRLDFGTSEARNWQDQLLAPDQVYGLFQSVLGINLTSEMAGWQQSLAGDIAAVQAELGSLTADVQRVQVDLSTPQKTLETWWNAYRAGDFSALIAASTSEMAGILSDARDMYIQQGILQQVILDNFIRPYRSAQMVVVQEGEFGDDLYVFQVQIVRGTDIQDMTIAVRKEGNQWKIDSN